MTGYIIAFEVGGIFLRTAIIDKEGKIMPDSYAIFPSKSQESKEEIIENLYLRIKQQTNRILDRRIKILGVGYAFPGPFDYERGISYVKDVGKFDQLYGVNLRKELLMRIKREPSLKSKLSSEFRILFDNDANLFALGEKMKGKGKNYNKAIYLRIGTGAGSAFMEQDALIKQGENIPENGWIYKDPFEDSIVNDYISIKGIMKLTEKTGISIKDNLIETLDEMARENNAEAKEVFYQFGRNIGKALNPYVHTFNSEAVILGGKVARSKEFLIGGIYETLGNNRVIIENSVDTTYSTFVGVSNLIKQSIQDN